MLIPGSVEVIHVATPIRLGMFHQRECNQADRSSDTSAVIDSLFAAVHNGLLILIIHLVNFLISPFDYTILLMHFDLLIF